MGGEQVEYDHLRACFDDRLFNTGVVERQRIPPLKLYSPS
jgi:hypothetical protein